MIHVHTIAAATYLRWFAHTSRRTTICIGNGIICDRVATIALTMILETSVLRSFALAVVETEIDGHFVICEPKKNRIDRLLHPIFVAAQSLPAGNCC